jgi:hypothetical protein
MSDEKLKPWTTEPLRAKLDAQFTAALQNDPVCNGRVSSATIDYLVDQAIFAAEATGRHAARSIESLSSKGHSEASVDELCAKLRAVESACHTCYHRNPDGPEAADALEAQALQIAGLREALDKIKGGFINSDCLMSDPPDWHNAFDQLQALARTALSNSVSGVKL